MRTVYLDHAATTPLDPRVFERMLPVLREEFGNASSLHTRGRRARFLVEECRERVATCIGATPAEIVFTGSATEANNTALFGINGRLVTSPIEHESVLNASKSLRPERDVTFVPIAPDGRPDPATLPGLSEARASLVSLMYVNNEVGSVSPVDDIAGICHQHGSVFHCDAVQAAGVYSLEVDRLGVDLMSVSAHKIGGPKGIGCLFVRNGVDMRPLLKGGAQERGRRAGTEDVAGIVGFARALELAVEERDANVAHLNRLRDRLLSGLCSTLGDRFVVNTPVERSAPHILNIAFPEGDAGPVDGEMLLLNLDLEGVQVSAGSACTSGALEPSHVLLAIGLDRATASAAVRFSIGRTNTDEDVDYAVDRLEAVCRRMHIL